MNFIILLFLLINASLILVAFLIQEYFKVFLFNRVSPTKVKIYIKQLLDPIGIILLIIFRVGWIIPTELNFFLVENRKKNIILVHLLPVILNLILGFIFLAISVFVEFSSFPFIATALQMLYTSQFTVFALSILPFYTMPFYRIYYCLASPTSKMKMMTSNHIVTLIFSLLIFMGVISIYVNFVTNLLTNLFYILLV